MLNQLDIVSYPPGTVLPVSKQQERENSGHRRNHNQSNSTVHTQAVFTV